MLDRISVHGARQHNLKNIDVEIPRHSFTVVTGLSGSGKSSLAFDTIYAEGQRRYVETLSPYARQFLDQLERPEVDSIDGLSPAISIEQKTTNRSPRSTVGTVTEIYDYVRLLYSSIGVPHCPDCGVPIARQSTEQILQIGDGVLCPQPPYCLPARAPARRVLAGAPRDPLRRPAHRFDESAAGCSLADWSPPEPASASPALIRVQGNLYPALTPALPLPLSPPLALASSVLTLGGTFLGGSCESPEISGEVVVGMWRYLPEVMIRSWASRIPRGEWPGAGELV